LFAVKQTTGDNMSYRDECEKLYVENIELKKQLDILKEAVEYYADKKRTVLEETVSGYRNIGGKASEALDKIEKIKL
jgi:tRNA A-37 threonylcarbamoyl transferase component Bud32